MHIRDIAIASGILTYDLIEQYEAIERSCLKSYHDDQSKTYQKCGSLLGFLSMIDGGIEIGDL